MAKTLYDKIWDAHTILSESGVDLIHIDRHLVHEVTSPQAFEGLRTAGRAVRCKEKTLCTLDHNVPTSSREGYTDLASFIEEPDSRTQCCTLADNVKHFDLSFFDMKDQRQGIVHVVGPEQGFTLPGTTVVCGDSHTSTHGAMGALAFGIGTSEVEHVLATQSLQMPRSKTMKILVDGDLPPGTTSKDVALHVIGIVGTAGGTGYVMEFCGKAIEDMSVEARMSLCNMSIEGGARAGLVAPDDKTFAYLKGRPMAPKGPLFEQAVAYWRSLRTDEGAQFDRTVVIPAEDIVPTVTWGTSPEQVVPITGCVPDPAQAPPEKRAGMERALEYMGLEPNTPMTSIKINYVFIGSCTNSRIEDLRAAAAVVEGKQVKDWVRALVVPGSTMVKQQAEAEGLSEIFKAAGMEWREAGCSMCLGMNPDQLKPGERCASTSNRNFEGRQGRGSRTHLVSPGMAAAAALAGHIADVRNYQAAPVKTKTASIAFPMGWDEARAAAIPVEPAAAAQAASGGGGSPSARPGLTVVTGIAIPYEVDNVDTDAIMPKQFLKTIQRSGLGKSIFYERRYDMNGVEVPDFVLNMEPYRTAPIMICGDNFGCGSSREHAPWGIADFGIKALIAPSFADIFFNNCFKNGMLCIKLPVDQVNALMEDGKAKKQLTIDLQAQTVQRESGESYPFDVTEFRKNNLLHGLDEIGLTLLKSNEIGAFEAAYREKYPFLHPGKPAPMGTDW